MREGERVFAARAHIIRAENESEVASNVSSM